MSKLPGPLQKLTSKVKTELDLTYRDILRIVFSKRFVRNRKVVMFAMMVPIVAYTVMVMIKWRLYAKKTFLGRIA